MTLKAKKVAGKLAVMLIAMILTFGPCLNASALMMDKLVNKYAPNKIGFYDEDACADGTTGGSATAVGGEAVVTGDKAIEKLWSGLKSMGLSDEVTAGIIGNAYGESGYNAAAYEGSFSTDWKAGIDVDTGISKGKDAYDYEHDPKGSRGIGLWGWSFDNRVNIWKYVKDHDKNVADFFFAHPEKYGSFYDGDEMIKQALSDGASEAQVDALYSLQISNMINDYLPKYAPSVLTQTTVESAASEMAIKGERCQYCYEGTAELQRRTDEAKKVFGEYAGKTSFGTPTTSNSSSGSVSTDGSNITIIGDSITDGAKSYFEKKLPGVDIYSKVSKHFYWDRPDEYGGESGKTILERLVKENKLRPILVFALGTNDVDGVVKENGTNYVDQILEIAKDAQKIVFVTNYIRNMDFKINNDAFNAAAAKDSRVVVADWAAIASAKDKEDQENPGGTTFLDSMYTHPNTEEANNAFVDVIIQAINGGGGTTNNQSSGTTSEECCDPSQAVNLSTSDEIYKTANVYKFTETELKQITAMANREQGSLSGVKFEVSLMANLFESHGGKPGDTQGFIDYITTRPSNGGWFADESIDDFYAGTNYSDTEQIEAVRDVLENGNRTIPPQVVEHDCYYPECDAGVWRFTNDGGNTWYEVPSESAAQGMLDKIQRGVSKFEQKGGRLSGSWIFWGWANPEKPGVGDPFGYLESNPPPASVTQSTKGSSATSAAGSSVTWDSDGWISGGMNGYSKMELSGSDDPGMFGAEYVTNGLDGKHDKGPNKITLHAFEGPGGDEGLIKRTYESGYPPHFTIDIKNHKVYQHMSIWKTSSAIAGTEYGDQSAGVQIEVMGYDNEKEYNEGLPGAKGWNLASSTDFSDENWSYLAELLNAISVETNIPLTSSVDWSKEDDDSVRLTEQAFKDYTGILGHKHTPLSSKPENNHYDLQDPVIWDYIQKALTGFSSSQQIAQCPPSGGLDVAALQDLVEEWTWKATEPEHGSATRKPAYDTVIKRRVSEGKFVGDMCEGKSGAGGGVDCGGFVTTLIQESGWDPNYNTDPGISSYGTTNQLNYLRNHPEEWEEVTDSITSNSNAQPGDVLIKSEGDSGGTHHTLVYVGEMPGRESPMASAGQCQWAPMEDNATDIMHYKNQGYHIFRNTTPPMTGGGSSVLPADGFKTYEEAKQFVNTNYFNVSKAQYEDLLNNKGWIHSAGAEYDYHYCRTEWCKDRDALSNCANFSQWFINAYTTIDLSHDKYRSIVSGAADTIAGDMCSKIPQLNGKCDNVPELYAVFSTGNSSNPHTGVILGINGDQVITGEACLCDAECEKPKDNGGMGSCNNARVRSKSDFANATIVHLKGVLK